MKHITQTIIENSLTELNRTELIVTLNHYYLRLDISNSDYWTLLTKINNNELTQMDELQKKITKFTL